MQTDTEALEVIIPVGPGETAWQALLQHLPRDWPIRISATEARPAHLSDRITWLNGPAGRGGQLNRAAESSRARWLWFVHADSLPDPTALAQIQMLCTGDTECLAYLDLCFFDDGPWLTRLNAIGANLRSRLLALPYGDQGLCVPRPWFWRLNGFREDLDRGEDLDFVIRARAAGLPPQRLTGRMQTSARRYREQGWLATSWRHQVNAWRLARDARSRLREEGRT